MVHLNWSNDFLETLGVLVRTGSCLHFYRFPTEKNPFQAKTEKNVLFLTTLNLMSAEESFMAVSRWSLCKLDNW